MGPFTQVLEFNPSPTVGYNVSDPLNPVEIKLQGPALCPDQLAPQTRGHLAANAMFTMSVAAYARLSVIRLVS